MNESTHNEAPTTAIELIAAERARQTSKHGYDSEHDHNYVNGELIHAAIHYSYFASLTDGERDAIRATGGTPEVPNSSWPWAFDEWRPGPDNSAASRIRENTKAAALLAAEVDRLLWWLRNETNPAVLRIARGE